jgi:hypothetical protein
MLVTKAMRNDTIFASDYAAIMNFSFWLVFISSISLKSIIARWTNTLGRHLRHFLAALDALLAGRCAPPLILTRPMGFFSLIASTA